MKLSELFSIMAWVSFACAVGARLFDKQVGYGWPTFVMAFGCFCLVASIKHQRTP